MIILSQRIDTESEYEDIPYSTYHFPKRYRNQIHPGDRFIYYQGDRYKKENRYYFGCGVIGTVEADETGDYFYAEIIEGKPFAQKVPIYHPRKTGFIESLGYQEVRLKPNPSWQNSIRKISDEAFYAILNFANVNSNAGLDASELESEDDFLAILKNLNQFYSNLPPKERARKVQNHIDRGTAVTKALKSLLGAKCQICGWSGFEKRSGGEFIEAHHIVQLSEKTEGSLCTENVILVCPNCHREIHYGKSVMVKDFGNYFEISLGARKAQIFKNTMPYLAAKKE
jgi:hypothetical protein